MICLFIACGKNDPNIIEHSSVTCDQVTLNLTNSLNKEIRDLFIDRVDVGDIPSGTTVTNICLNRASLCMGSISVNLVGIYKGEQIGWHATICGFFTLDEIGSHDIEITKIENGYFQYEVL